MLSRILEGHRLDRTRFERRLPVVRDELLSLQKEAHESRRPALAVILTGIPAAGRSETINELMSWLDPKRVSVHAFEDQEPHDRDHPPMWRYWRSLPPCGRIAFYFGGWYADYLWQALHGKRKSQRARARTLERICQLEKMLTADGVRLVKIHLHIGRKTQKRRLARLRASELTRWRVTKEDRWLAAHYGKAERAIEQSLRATNAPHAPWHLVDGTDQEHRLLRVGEILRDALRAGLAPSRAKRVAPRARRAADKAAVRSIESPAVSAAEYERELEQLQGRVALLMRRKAFRDRGLVLAFEGMDAAGKGGAIRRLTHALDARQYRVVAVSAPTSEERSYPYLWRFWREMPERGRIAIFDRSWYGRVLVERVRGLSPVADWQRAYAEICELERQLIEHGLIVAKLWLDVSKREQLKRFRARDADRLKRFKVDPEDWLNRRHFEAYQVAAAEMIHRTDAPDARWHPIASDDKRAARLEVLRRVCETVERALGE